MNHRTEPKRTLPVYLVGREVAVRRALRVLLAHAQQVRTQSQSDEGIDSLDVVVLDPRDRLALRPLDGPAAPQGVPRDPASLAALTPREREVLQLVATGLANKDIARELDIAPTTVKKHRANLQRKLDCHSIAGLTRIAIRTGMSPV